MFLRDLSRNEVLILTAIVALAKELPGDLGDYTRALGELRAQYFDVPSRTRGQKKGSSFVENHEPRVRKRWDG